jgi:hypothetical protein
MSVSVLDLLKESDCGLTQSQLDEKAKKEGIKNSYKEVGTLIVQGKVRFDENPSPGRFKATPLAWQ